MANHLPEGEQFLREHRSFLQRQKIRVQRTPQSGEKGFDRSPKKGKVVFIWGLTPHSSPKW